MSLQPSGDHISTHACGHPQDWVQSPLMAVRNMQAKDEQDHMRTILLLLSTWSCMQA